ncbi:MAG: twin-arginine translocation signal domain-containing protein [Polyangiales bacterium]
MRCGRPPAKARRRRDARCPFGRSRRSALAGCGVAVVWCGAAPGSCHSMWKRMPKSSQVSSRPCTSCRMERSRLTTLLT